jgi:OPT oligopeptide transporter protein
MIIGLVAVILVFFSTAVMSYVSMATPIGPWIAPTLVLFAYVLLKLLRTQPTTTKMIGLISLSSIGGILATACGFSFPALYFLDTVLFNEWLSKPWYFVSMLSSLSFVSGWFGIWIANLLEKRMLHDPSISFPIGHLIFKMISIGHQTKEIIKLIAGTVLYATVTVLQYITWFGTRIIPLSIRSASVSIRHYTILPPIFFDLSIMPMLIAIGFVTGQVIALPLVCGALGRMLVLNPLRTLFFSELSTMEFSLAFCSGMVLVGAISGFAYWPKSALKWWRNLQYHEWKSSYKEGFHLAKDHLIELFLFVSVFIAWSYSVGFSPLVQIYLLITSYACVYNMVFLGGQTGLAYLGRFATFVMVPALLIFNLDYVQIVFIATFVEIAGGVAVDVMFGRKMAQLANLPPAYVKHMQYIGLALTSLFIGCIFWLLVTKFQLGSPVLFAYKAQARKLLICAQHFNYTVLALGALAGWLLGQFRINPGMVLGGILMPLDVSLGLIIGGLGATLCPKKEDWYSFWSGIFAANSLWMLLSNLWS